MDIYTQDCHTASGEPFNLRALRGQVLMVVNVASQCRFTPQLAELETLYQTHQAQGFTVLAFPCNQFLHQSPESGRSFEQFCTRSFKTSFPIMEKVNVNGANAHPLFQLLKHRAPGVLRSRQIKWNFTKFLIGRDGHVMRRFAPAVSPSTLSQAIDEALAIPFSA
ncbi:MULTISPECIES: glutathione peroxidase [Larsenimonas]|uniref:Glutathione peroxidase n=1 Tax=Larsenimonas suaedae TaxID=1851019 RepID=A0ABU1GSZ3_9GAMM|nr:MULTISPECIES: glutathione peroxidase [Larsenimonas]MCM2972061.1 glutathione peroxidase [Larsenimonas suaedae]MCM5704382.1 glutathione peroxidase [Larsenimonas salina]MDR5895145.1 glutathione peroxidase [Larsenimonas suaedae]